MVDSLTNEIRWKYFLELLLGGTERIMNLRVGHWAALEPTVKNLFDSFEFSFALTGFDCQVVDVLSVQVGDFVTCQFL